MLDFIVDDFLSFFLCFNLFPFFEEFLCFFIDEFSILFSECFISFLNFLNITSSILFSSVLYPLMQNIIKVMINITIINNNK